MRQAKQGLLCNHSISIHPAFPSWRLAQALREWSSRGARIAGLQEPLGSTSHNWHLPAFTGAGAQQSL